MNKIKAMLLFVILLTFGAVQIHSESVSENYNLVTDVLDELGGASQSSNFKISTSSGGQPSPVGVGTSSNFEGRGGYIHSAWVLRGDATADGTIDAGDSVYLINYLFLGGSDPIPLEAGDLDCNGVVDVGDLTYLTTYLYLGGSPPCML